MPSKNPAQRLRDILDNIDAIASFTAGLDFRAFAGDRRTVYAVTRALEIISESSRRLPEAIKGRHPEIDWIAIASAGNVYRHEYETVEDLLLWNTVRHELAALRQVTIAELQRALRES